MPGKLRSLAFCAAVANVLVVTAQAHADAIYTYDGISASAPSNPAYQPLGLDLTLDIADAAVARGSFDLSGFGQSGGPGAAPSFTGDVGDFVSLASSSLGGLVAPDSFAALQSFSLSLTFDPLTGAVTSSAYRSSSADRGDAAINGVGATASGTVSSDNPYPCPAVPGFVCDVTGLWSGGSFGTILTGGLPTLEQTGDPSIPEPASFALLCAGLLGFRVLRYRRAG